MWWIALAALIVSIVSAPGRLRGSPIQAGKKPVQRGAATAVAGFPDEGFGVAVPVLRPGSDRLGHFGHVPQPELMALWAGVRTSRPACTVVVSVRGSDPSARVAEMVE